MEDRIKYWFGTNQDDLKELAVAIFNTPELAYNEYESSKKLLSYISSHGFTVEENYADIPTAFRASWGSGAPIIGLIAEYDALPGLDQSAGTPHYNGDKQKSGHACGHNLLGAACACSAVALKEAMKFHNINGTVVLYGCPAEETLSGKTDMAKKGAFKELDAAISWHPSDVNQTGNRALQALDSLEISFFGKSAHAAANPDMGRSALDAAELTNVGINYLREHIPSECKIHYSYLNAGEKPNIVPDFAKVWYFVRARDRKKLNEVTERVLDVAKGAALMTSTNVKFEFLSRVWHTLINENFCKLGYEVMSEIQPDVYTDEELNFAKSLSQSLPDYNILPKYSEDIVSPPYLPQYVLGSSDLSDVSQITPTLAIRTACAPINTPMHHWSFTACSNSSAGIKGSIYAAKVMAECGFILLTNEKKLSDIKEEFKQNSEGWHYPE